MLDSCFPVASQSRQKISTSSLYVLREHPNVLTESTLKLPAQKASSWELWPAHQKCTALFPGGDSVLVPCLGL